MTQSSKLCICSRVRQRLELRDFCVVDCSSARDSAISERCTISERSILPFLSYVLTHRVEFCHSRAMELPSACNSAISERWTTPARGILQFPSGGRLPHARFCDFWVMDYSTA